MPASTAATSNSQQAGQIEPRGASGRSLDIWLSQFVLPALYLSQGLNQATSTLTNSLEPDQLGVWQQFAAATERNQLELLSGATLSHASVAALSLSLVQLTHSLWSWRWWLTVSLCKSELVRARPRG